MADHKIAQSSSTEGLPVAPSMGPTLSGAATGRRSTLVEARNIVISGLAVAIGLAAALLAQLLIRLIGLITNLSFYGRASLSLASPAGNHLGLLVVVLPALGGLIVGLMARYGSEGIRGHGIPEVMQRVLQEQSRIPPRDTFLKPLSAAIAIGTGGPFGAEGPIIASGAAFGSLIGQLLETTAEERKTLLAAGAAAGMAATFGSPVSAVLLAVELLLFEFRPRSLIPVTFASVTATALRVALVGARPMFLMPAFAAAGLLATACYVALGLVAGVASVWVTRAVYAVEDGFAELPMHWMWWPALGGLVVGLVGYFAPRTLGVGYDNITTELSAGFGMRAVAVLCLLKFVSWAVSLGSGTSGGTLAPLFIIGGALGAAVGSGLAHLAPGLGVHPGLAALVGMTAIFAGASRALLASVIFGLETTMRPLAVVPLLGGCTAAYLVSSLLMKDTIMTEKIARRGLSAPSEYSADFLTQLLVGEAASRQVVTLDADALVAAARGLLTDGGPHRRHHGYPVVDAQGQLLGVVTWRDILDPALAPSAKLREAISRRPVVIFEDDTLRDAGDLMVREGVGRLPVVSRQEPNKVVAVLSRHDIMAARGRYFEQAGRRERLIRLFGRTPSRAERSQATPASR